MKKILSLVLSLTLVLSLGVGFTAMAEETERVDLTLGIQNLGAYEDKDWYPDMYLAHIGEQLGVNILWTKYDNDMMAIALASGDHKHVMMANDPIPVLNAGAALALDDYLDEYGQNIKKYELRNELLRKYMSNGDGKLYFHTPNTGYEDQTGGQTGWNGYLVRWDLYAELGYPEMNSYEDWLNVIEQMVALYPENENGEKTYGMGIWNDSGLWGWQMGAIANLGFSTAGDYNFGWDTKTNELRNWIAETEENDANNAFWTNFKFFNQLYRRGLLDPDSFSMTQDDLNEKYANNRYVSGICTWYVGELYDANREVDPNTTAGIVAVPVKGGSGWYGQNAIIGWNGKNLFVSSSCPEDMIPYAVSFIDYMDSDEGNRTNYSGIQGIHWDYDAEGVPYIFEETKALQSAGGEEWQKTGIKSQANLIGSSAFGVAEDGYYYDLSLYNLGEGLSPLYQAYCEHYGVDYPGQLRYNYEQAGEGYSQAVSLHTTIGALAGDIPDDISTITSRLTEMTIRNIQTLVTAESDEAFAAAREQFTADCVAAGLNEAYEWYSTKYSTLAAEITEIVNAQN